MPKFYFDLHLNGKKIWDDHGQQLPTLKEARMIALTTAHQAAKCCLALPTVNLDVYVRREDGETALAIAIAVAPAV
jgi:hypothetical protein